MLHVSVVLPTPPLLLIIEIDNTIYLHLFSLTLKFNKDFETLISLVAIVDNISKYAIMDIMDSIKN